MTNGFYSRLDEVRGSGHLRHNRDVTEVGAIGRAGVKARVRALAIAEVPMAPQRAARLANAVVGPQIHLLVFDRPLQPLDEYVVA